MAESTRAGRYIEQVEGYRAFIPAPLPPEPAIAIDSEMWELLSQIALLESLYFRPIFAVEHAEKITGLSYPNANKLIKDLCDIGILQEITGQKRNRAFAYDPYLQVFQDD